MATKVSVIEIDLGVDVDSIISENLEALTGKAKQELDTAIELIKQRDELKNKKKNEKDKANDAITQSIEEAYNKLVGADSDGVLCSDIIDIVSNNIANASAFTLRMKKFLRDNGNQYTLQRKKIKGNQHYILLPFNKE